MKKTKRAEQGAPRPQWPIFRRAPLPDRGAMTTMAIVAAGETPALVGTPVSMARN